jgi:AraC-like DNA-binding protein
MKPSIVDIVAPNIIHEYVGLSLYRVSVASYDWIRLVNIRYPYWIISHVRYGAVEMRAGNQTWSINAGDVMLHAPHMTYDEIANIVGLHEWFMLDIRGLASIELFKMYSIAPTAPLVSPEDFTQKFKKLMEICQSPSSGLSNLQAFSLTIQLLDCLIESWKPLGNVSCWSTPTLLDRHFIEVISYMESRLYEKITRENLAALVNLHPNYLDRAFRTVYGITPMHMLRDLRLRRAQQLLESTDDTLATIAAACGLTDAAYFTRIFHQRHKQTPGEYRKRVRNMNDDYL